MDHNDLQENAADAAEQVGEAVGSLANDARGRVEETARGAQDTYAQVRDRVADTASVINASVQHQPLIALLVAGTLGCMLGLLLARR